MRVLWLTERYHPDPGGMAQACDRIVQRLRGPDVIVDVLHFAPSSELYAVENRQHGRDIVCQLHDDVAHSLNIAWNAIAADRHRHALTHVVAFGGMLPLLAGPIYAAWLDRPLVTLIRGNDFDAGIFTPGRRKIVRDALLHASRVCVVSRDKAHKIRALYPQVPITYIPNGIDVDSWSPLPSETRKARAWREQVVQPERRVLGVIGQIKAKKGVELMLECMLEAGLADRFHLHFVGDLDEELAQLLDEVAPEIEYTLLPYADRYALIQHYLACDLIAIPSFYDGLPNVLLEAGALGVPALASTAGGMGDILVDGEHGFLFMPGDYDGCRDALGRAGTAGNEELRRMGAALAATIRRDFTHAIEGERYLQVLRDTTRSMSPA